MSLSSERDEIHAVVNRVLDNLSGTISSQSGREGISLRQKIGTVRSDYFSMLADRTFATELLACFTSARTIPVKLLSLASFRQTLFDESPVGNISKAIIQIAIVYCLSAESRLITNLTFVSRDDVDNLMARMKTAFDTARDLLADNDDAMPYQTLTSLAGSLTQHLVKTARPLPRMIKFTMRAPIPALALSQQLYYVGDRSDEIIDENKIINPCFCPREIRGLSQ